MPIQTARGMAEVIADEEAEYDPAGESLVLVPLLPLSRGAGAHFRRTGSRHPKAMAWMRAACAAIL